MIEYEDIYGVNYFKYGEPFYGSDTGMRYRLEKYQEEVEGEKKELKLKATIWPEPMGFDSTPEEQKQVSFYSFDETGRHEMIDWLNESHQDPRFKPIWSRY